MRKAVDARPGLAELHNDLGKVLHRLGRRREARESFREAVRLDPSYAEAHFNLGLLCAEEGRLEEAAERYRSALAASPCYAKALNNLGSVLFRQGRPRDSEQKLRASRCRASAVRQPSCARGADLLLLLAMLIHTFVTGPLETNTYLVADRALSEAMVIDPGGDPAEILAFLAKERLRCTQIVNTHGHFDHISGNKVLKSATGATLLIHEADAPLLSQAAGHARFFNLNAENSPGPDGFLSDREPLKVGKLLLRVLHTPGHTPGGVTIVADGVAFCGDLVFHGSVGRTDLPGGSERVLLDSIRRCILTMPEHTVLYPGHGPETTVGLEKRQNPFFRML
jgi:glyoxylase-like metal-dependent hydrolase (beta-lactamase superfamily II)